MHVQKWKLKWAKHFSITAAIAAVEMRTMRYRVLREELCFLQ